jgi:sugar lactone lactonase YvrE
MASLALLTCALPARPEIVFSQANPLFPSNSLDLLRSGPAGGNYTERPLPGGAMPLEFPWDVAYANGRIYIIGAGQDNGTMPPGRVFDFEGKGTIWSVKPDGSDPQLHASGLNRPLHLDVTPDGATIYFSEQGSGEGSSFGDNGRVARLDLATGAVETVVNAPDNAGPTGVAYDPASGTLYYQVINRGTDTTMQQIRRVTDAASAADVAAGADELFLTNPEPPGGYSSPVDGTEFPVLSAGRALDVFDGFIYFTYRNGAFNPNSEIRRIPRSFNLATEDPETFESVIGSTFGGIRIIDFAIDEGTLFFTDAQQNGVFSVKLDENGMPSGTPSRVATGKSDFSSLPIGLAVISELTPTERFEKAAYAAGLRGADALPNATPFGDGVPNLLKYAFNMDLSRPDNSTLAPDGIAGLPGHQLNQAGDSFVWRVEFLRRKQSGLVYTPLKSTVPPIDSFVPLSAPPTVTRIDQQWERVVIEESFDPHTTPRIFTRVTVELPSPP